jgi:hypothetical protein
MIKETSERQRKYHERRAKERLEAEPILTDKQLEIITGSLLGDATLTKIVEKKCKNSCFVVAHSEAQKGYVEWMHDELVPVSKDITMRLSKPTTICGRYTPGGVPTYHLETQRHSTLTEMERKWYKRDATGEYAYKVVNDKKYRIKVVPPDLVLTPLTVAIWFFDDGSIRTAERNAWLYTQAFSWEEVAFLVESLKKLGISDCFVDTKKSTPVVHVACDSFLDFIDMVKPYLPHSDLAYKVDVSGYIEPKFTKMREQDRLHIVELFDSGLNCTDIAKQVGFSVSAVSLLLRDYTGKQERLDNTSGVTGVSRVGARWQAGICQDGKFLHLGVYKDKAYAAAIRKEAEALRDASVVNINEFYRLREKYAQFREKQAEDAVSSVLLLAARTAST